MRTLYTIFTIFTVSCVFPAIQADEIEETREYYNDVMERLDDEYGLYRTEISINTEDGIYPAIGNYQETITFYWGAEGGYEWLVLVIWTGEYASRRTYGEILYEPQAFLEDRKEEVVFQYVSDLDWDGNTTEYQWWYDSNGLLQSSATTTFPDEVVEFIPDGPEDYPYIYTPQRMQEIFYMIHSRQYS